mmetsp:Transcript_114975/g.256715  ORF Transcript_114975/g.256715 Transcript_114975/m.256715 type:complete len:209 (+) Transcript_114975:722-1348(+)
MAATANASHVRDRLGAQAAQQVVHLDVFCEGNEEVPVNLHNDLRINLQRRILTRAVVLDLAAVHLRLEAYTSQQAILHSLHCEGLHQAVSIPLLDEACVLLGLGLELGLGHKLSEVHTLGDGLQDAAVVHSCAPILVIVGGGPAAAYLGHDPVDVTAHDPGVHVHGVGRQNLRPTDRSEQGDGKEVREEGVLVGTLVAGAHGMELLRL